MSLSQDLKGNLVKNNTYKSLEEVGLLNKLIKSDRLFKVNQKKALKQLSSITLLAHLVSCNTSISSKTTIKFQVSLILEVLPSDTTRYLVALFPKSNNHRLIFSNKMQISYMKVISTIRCSRKLDLSHFKINIKQLYIIDLDFKKYSKLLFSICGTCLKYSNYSYMAEKIGSFLSL